MGKGISRSQVLFMVVTCILVIGNLYYNQPLLGILAREFGVSEKDVAIVPAATMIGYAVGILFLVPLADMLERRRLLQIFMSVAGLLALAIPHSPTITVMSLLSFLLGFFNVSATILIPFSANLARPEERGKVVGTVLAGILLGTLMGRAVAGLITEHFSWQTVFYFAGIVNILLAIITRWTLPSAEAQFKGTYTELLRSTFQLVKQFSLVREAALMGAILFGSFSMFWTTLTFLLENRPFEYSPQTIGLFGILGLIGAAAAPLAGRYADKKGTAATIRLGLYCSMAAFALLALSSTWALGIVLGVLLLDLGIQVAHISNQTRMFALSEEARSRMSSIYIFCYFVGGSLGSYIGSLLWTWGQWQAVSLGGLFFCLFATLVFKRGQRKRLLSASH